MVHSVAALGTEPVGVDVPVYQQSRSPARRIDIGSSDETDIALLPQEPNLLN